ncbi:MAG: hypothetical protein G01um101466_350 [Parcubacteria group bacterium Gr01-1014_66]|nr:MAG: hypothetical protein G01um101466_350 [Parcubacteria group bacterium Gr01-1014_66]
MHASTRTLLILSTVCLVVLGAFYIYGVNETAVHTFGKEADLKHLLILREEVRTLETERAHLAVGLWLEERARRAELVSGGTVHFLSRDTSVARADF